MQLDKVLSKLWPLFDELYAQESRPSIPPEKLLKSARSWRSMRCAANGAGANNGAYNLLWL
jgi:hypothetical protein